MQVNGLSLKSKRYPTCLAYWWGDPTKAYKSIFKLHISPKQSCHLVGQLKHTTQHIFNIWLTIESCQTAGRKTSGPSTAPRGTEESSSKSGELSGILCGTCSGRGNEGKTMGTWPEHDGKAMELPNSHKFDGLSMFITILSIFPSKTICLAAKSHVSRNYLGSNPRYIFFRHNRFSGCASDLDSYISRSQDPVGWVKNL